MQAEVYEWLHHINAGFQEVLRGLAALQEHRAFQRRELQRCAALAKEIRAVLNSSLTEAIERAETAEAGRRYHQRRQRERRDESGKGSDSADRSSAGDGREAEPTGSHARRR